jgi:hypothetical protein
MSLHKVLFAHFAICVQNDSRKSQETTVGRFMEALLHPIFPDWWTGRGGPQLATELFRLQLLVFVCVEVHEKSRAPERNENMKCVT